MKGSVRPSKKKRKEKGKFGSWTKKKYPKCEIRHLCDTLIVPAVFLFFFPLVHAFVISTLHLGDGLQLNAKEGMKPAPW